MKTNYFWKNKRVLITGGTSGLGKALAHRLINLESKVVVISRGHLPNDQKIKHIQGDISDKEQIHRIHAEAVSYLGGVDILFNNASSLGVTPLRLLADTECEDLSKVIETNLMGPFRLTKLVLPEMMFNKFGLVVNISSDAAVNAYEGWGAYGVSKAALDHLTRIFQVELENSGLKFLALDPGDMNTPLHLAAIPDAKPENLHSPMESADLIIEQISLEQYLPTRRSLR